MAFTCILQNAITSLSKEHSRWSLLGDIMNSLLTSTDGCSPGLLGAYITFLIANRTEFLQIDFVLNFGQDFSEEQYYLGSINLISIFL